MQRSDQRWYFGIISHDITAMYTLKKSAWQTKPERLHLRNRIVSSSSGCNGLPSDVSDIQEFNEFAICESRSLTLRCSQRCAIDVLADWSASRMAASDGKTHDACREELRGRGFGDRDDSDRREAVRGCVDLISSAGSGI